MAKYNKLCACGKSLPVPTWNICYDCSATLKRKDILKRISEIKYDKYGSGYLLPTGESASDIRYMPLNNGTINKLEAMGIPVDYVDTVVVDNLGRIIGYKLVN